MTVHVYLNSVSIMIKNIIYSNVHNSYSMGYIQTARENIHLAALNRQVNIPSLPLDSLSPVSNS